MYSTSLCRSISALAFAAALSTRASANSSKSLLVTSMLRLEIITLNSTPRRSYDKKNAATRTGDSVKFCIIYLIGKFYQFYPTYFKFYPTLYPTTFDFHPTSTELLLLVLIKIYLRLLRFEILFHIE